MSKNKKLLTDPGHPGAGKVAGKAIAKPSAQGNQSFRSNPTPRCKAGSQPRMKKLSATRPPVSIRSLDQQPLINLRFLLITLCFLLKVASAANVVQQTESSTLPEPENPSTLLKSKQAKPSTLLKQEQEINANSGNWTKWDVPHKILPHGLLPAKKRQPTYVCYPFGNDAATGGSNVPRWANVISAATPMLTLAKLNEEIERVPIKYKLRTVPHKGTSLVEDEEMNVLNANLHNLPRTGYAEFFRLGTGICDYKLMIIKKVFWVNPQLCTPLLCPTCQEEGAEVIDEARAIGCTVCNQTGVKFEGLKYFRFSNSEDKANITLTAVGRGEDLKWFMKLISPLCPGCEGAGKKNILRHGNIERSTCSECAGKGVTLPPRYTVAKNRRFADKFLVCNSCGIQPYTTKHVNYLRFDPERTVQILIPCRHSFCKVCYRKAFTDKGLICPVCEERVYMMVGERHGSN